MATSEHRGPSAEHAVLETRQARDFREKMGSELSIPSPESTLR
jgi:hypothetical protein